MTEQEPHELARLLGVPADTAPDRLRAAYEQAMNRATRAGDHSRALQLSRAFDALPDRTRSSVYSGGRTYATVLTPEPRERSPRRRRHNAAPRAPRRRRRFSWKGVVGYGIVVPAIVVLVGWIVYRQNNPDYEEFRPPPVDRVSTVVEQPPAPALRVPASAPVGSNGSVNVLCQAAPGEPGEVIPARRGERVTCPNRATPRVISP